MINEAYSMNFYNLINEGYYLVKSNLL